MRHILAVAILSASLASGASAALAYSRNNDPGIPQRSWDGTQAPPPQVSLANTQTLVPADALSVVAGPGFDDGYNPYRPNPGTGRLGR